MSKPKNENIEPEDLSNVMQLIYSLMIDMDEWILEDLNRIAYHYIAPKGHVEWKLYENLWTTDIWYLGIKIRQISELAKRRLGGKKIDWDLYDKGSFHHEPPYRNHWHTLFTTGKFIKNHKKGKSEANEQILRKED